MSEIGFVKVSPTANMTVLVTTEHPVDEYLTIAGKLMAYDHIHAEQVGFVRKSSSASVHAGLWMAAGEFCGNACMALAAVNASEDGVGVGDCTEVVMETTGTEDLVHCAVTGTGDHSYACRLAMPAPIGIRMSAPVPEPAGDVGLVVYDKAIHAVIEADSSAGAVRRCAEALAVRLAISWQRPLVAVLVYQPRSGWLAPLVHLPALGSMVWEQGCGSGTASLGAYLSWKRGLRVATDVVQPGGAMTVDADYRRNMTTRISVGATVTIVAKGSAYLD